LPPGAVVEALDGIFERSEINGGAGRNILVLGDSDSTVYAGGVRARNTLERQCHVGWRRQQRR
jgi:hypothetical protein